jgi:hypothetical protein
VLQDPSFLLREDDHLPGPFCEALKHVRVSFSVWVPGVGITPGLLVQSSAVSPMG